MIKTADLSAVFLFMGAKSIIYLKKSEFRCKCNVVENKIGYNKGVKTNRKVKKQTTERKI
jgi:hypothetical protein